MTKLNLSSWYVLRVRSRRELHIRDALQLAGIQAYVPEMRVEWRHRRTKAWQFQTRVLFPGYVFCRIEQQSQWRVALGQSGVVGPLGTRAADGGVEPSPVPFGLVEDLQSAEASMAFDDTREARRLRGEHRSVRELFPAGRAVTVLDGPLQQMAGTVESVTGKGLVQVLVDLFGRLTTVQVRPENLSAA